MIFVALKWRIPNELLTIAAVQQVLDMGELKGVELYCFDDAGVVSPHVPTATYMHKELKDTSAAKPVLKAGQEPGYFDVLCYVYTSGTTGLPKAAVIKNFR